MLLSTGTVHRTSIYDCLLDLKITMASISLVYSILCLKHTHGIEIGSIFFDNVPS